MTASAKLAFLVVAALALTPLSFLGGARASNSHEGNLLKPMLVVLEKSGMLASLVFSSRCEAPTPPEFPPLRVVTSTDGPPITTLREMLANDEHIRLTQDGRMIRMQEIGVPEDILNVRIGHVSFNGVYSAGSYGVDDPNEALHIIMGSPEVESFIKAHHLYLIFNDTGIGVGGEGKPNRPHLSGSFDNVTIQQALDRVLETFPGIWVYQNCPEGEDPRTRLSPPFMPPFPQSARNRSAYFRFFYLREWGAGEVVEF